MIGLLCLLSHIIIPAQQLGILSAWGVGFAMLGTLTFIPAVLAVLPRAKPVFDAAAARQGGAGHLLDRLLSRLAGMLPRRPRAVLLGSALVSLLVGVGATRIVVNTNPMSFYRETEPVWRSTHILNEHLGGWAGVSVVLEGDIKDPKALRAIDDLEQHLKRHPAVGTTTSIATVMRAMNRVMHDDDPAYDRIPETRELVAQYLLLYSLSGKEEDFEKLVDFPYRHAQVMAKVTDSGTQAATEVLAYTRHYLVKQSGGGHVLVGGFLDVMVDMVHHIVWGQVLSMGLAGLLVALMVALMLRSFVGGLLAVSPLVLALLMIFGVMGFAGIELNLITALLSSIMIGVGVDYSIHFLWRYRDERRNGLSPEQAVERTLRTTGRGIVFNALSVVLGFAVLVISAFYPVRFFGLLVAVSILASLAGALVVLPTLVIVLRPKFLEPRHAARDDVPAAEALPSAR
jgi:predicted RND superfamily exporter protein